MKAYTTKKERSLEELARRAAELVVRHRLFLHAHFTLDELARLLDVPRFYLSRAFNLVAGRSFSTFVNELRLAEARRLIAAAEDGKPPSVASLARLSGFHDRKNFHRVCRRMTGLSPDELRSSVSDLHGRTSIERPRTEKNDSCPQDAGETNTPFN